MSTAVVLIAMLAGAPFPARGSTVDCSPLLVEEATRLDAALRHAYFLDEWHCPTSRLGRLDADIRAWVTRELGKLSTAGRDTFLEILETRPDALEMPPDSCGGVMTSSDVEGVQLMLNSMDSRTELFRYVLVHELGHVLRLAPAGSNAAAAARLDGVMKRRHGIFREEMYAEREAYRWVKRNFSVVDVTRLEALAARYDALIARAKAMGLDMKIESAVAHFRGRASPERALVEAIMEASVAGEMAFFVETVLEAESEPEYLKNYALSYRKAQRRMDRNLRCERFLDWLKGLGSRCRAKG